MVGPNQHSASRYLMREAIKGHQGHAEAIIGHQRPSEVLSEVFSEVLSEVSSEAIRSRQRLPIHALYEEAPKRKLESRRVECAEPKRDGQQRARRRHPVGGAAVEHL